MRLLATGLCVRAAQSARANAAIPSRPLLTPVLTARRFNSTEAASEQEDYPTLNKAVPDPIRRILSSKREKRPTQQDVQSIPLPPQKGARTSADGKIITIDGRPYTLDNISNLSSTVTSLIGRRLYDTPNHPISITRKLIESVFTSPHFSNHVAYSPVATLQQNFDVLGFPANHPGRSRTDTYYVNTGNVLRTHTSAHQHQAFQHLAQALPPRQGYTICADVYRRDSIDKSHFPVFHQMEGARVWKLRHGRGRELQSYELHDNRVKEIVDDYTALPKGRVEVVEGIGAQTSFNLQTNPPQVEHSMQEVRVLVTHLKRSLENLFGEVFEKAREAGLGDESIQEGEKLKVRWVEGSFPFTSPSFELEIFWQGEWMEMLGCGIVKQRILNMTGLKENIGWAWGLGVERLAMLLFGVPDIRLFWSEDPRFLSQFKEGQITKFVPFSKYPACYKDVAFWIDGASATPSRIGDKKGTAIGVAAAAGGDATKASPTETQPTAFHENDVMEIVREVAGSLAEDVQVVDEFVHPTSGRKSSCYRINYRSLERTLTNEEVNEMHEKVVQRIGAELRVELR